MKSSTPDTRGYASGTVSTGLGPMRQTPAGKAANDTVSMKGTPRQVGVGKPFPGTGKPSISSLGSKKAMGTTMKRTVKG
jgi:hypothetical protein